MRSWWVKLSSKEEKKKANKESVLDAIQRKIKITSEQTSNSRSGGSHKRNDTPLQRGSVSRVPSRSPSPSKHVSRCQSFAERPQPRAQPLPLPVVRHSSIKGCDSGLNESERTGRGGCSNPLHILPLPKTYCVPNQLDQTDAEADLATASVSSDGSNDSDDPSDSHFLSPVISDHENGNKTNANTPSSILHRNHSPGVKQKSLKDTMKPPTFSLDNEIPSLSPKRAPKSNRVQNIQIPPRGAFFSAPDSSMSSPSTSPLRSFFAGRTCTDVGLLSSGQCSSPGSGYNSGQNSIGGDMSGQLFWPNSRCSPECSPIPSPKNISPGPSSRIHSGAVTPTHPRAGGITAESPSNRPDDGKHPSHRLPLPPISISKTGPFSPTYSTSTSPSVPRSPNRSENSISPPGSRWKKGRQLGRGTFGDVFLGFNRESGEMCAMKEVTLFTDDPKSRESAQQLGQEVMLLSRLRHPNIVQYYGSEMVDDKLYIYLEYVSGGSIYKLLQEYGEFGEIAIRSYTQQILSGLAYLHGKNTVHRDIKGANILVEPSGRRVKLADFGMAKHITGQACPLSFKGSPHWMAPEVMNNANGCNLAVDIWSLGCTVVEMATTKPPWSQYEGVAALFKIGHSKEQPAIPEKLSEEGKDFVRKCLQRNPFHRPTAAKLLEHPFVKNAAPLERPIMIAEPLESTPHTMDVGRSMGFGHPRNFPGFESEGAAVHQPRGLANGLGSSDFLTPKNLSSPVSPIGSPLWNSRSPSFMSGRMSPSPISSPPTASGSSTPLTGGGGAIPFNHSMQPLPYFQESIGPIARSQNNFYTNTSNAYQDPKLDHFPGIMQASHVFREMISSENISAENRFIHPVHGNLSVHQNGQSVSADCVSQQLLRDHGKMKPTLDLNPGAAVVRKTNRI